MHNYIFYIDETQKFSYCEGCYFKESPNDVKVGDIIEYRVNGFGGLWEDEVSFCKIHYSVFYKVESIITVKEDQGGGYVYEYHKVILSLHHKSEKAIVRKNGSRQQRTVYLQANGSYGVKKAS